jgi:hypothetical protein
MLAADRETPVNPSLRRRASGACSNRTTNTKMRKHTKYVGALAAASALVAGYASAGSTAPIQSAPATVTSGSDLTGEVHVGYSSLYEFRFVDLGSDLIEAGIDLSYDLNENFGLSAGAWYGSVNDSQTFGNSFNELDLYAAASTNLGPVSLELGYIYYFFSDTPGTVDTQEVYLSAGMDLFWGVNASATAYYDFDSNNGWYLQPELSKSFEFTDCIGLNLSAGVGIADGHGLQISDTLGSVGTADGFQGWFVKAELPWQFRENMTLAPYVKYVDADSDLVSDTPLVGGTGTLGGREHLIGGVKLTVGF